MTLDEQKAEAAYLRSLRTQTQAEVDERNKDHAPLARYHEHDRSAASAH